ncbi:MAG: peptidoglycan DD-metalloendopeptidase family protein [Flavobacteriaceae bacterium]
MKYFSIILILLVTFSCKKDVDESTVKPKPTPVVPKIIKEFGFTFNDYNYLRDTIRKGDSFGNILDQAHIMPTRVYEIVKKTKKVFDIRRLKVGNPYVILKSKDSLDKGEVFIYQPDKINYIVFKFKDTIKAYRAKKKVKTVIKTASGIIKTSLSEAIDEQGLNYLIVNDLSEIYAWTIDFFRLQKNDRFKIVYEERYVNDSILAGMGKVRAAVFEHNKKPLYAFAFVENKKNGVVDYFDDNAKNLRRAFLKAPLKFSRISSRYNMRRYIKYYGRIKPHLGTDFAAPTNTPIMATANGRVTKRGYTRGNGNYVKIRHNATYSTQYLHMNKFKKGVNVGTYVKQGDIIGYVGMTGHASGPHVCYRFWKNGRQVNPLRQKLPAAAPMKKSERPRFFANIKPLKEQLDNISYPN